MRFFSKNNSLESKNDRQLWVNVLSKIANPVLTNMASGTLKKNMPVEYVKKDRAKFAHLEAVGRLICGISPWLELGPDNSDEGKLRSHYIDLTTRGLVNVCNPQKIILFLMSHISH